ncbi:MAG: helix-turn-helix domain-containing protein [Actinobacteria bacterium]|nr:helix-turn-helix domain-containing protein [Actinomycetota bacterium]
MNETTPVDPLTKLRIRRRLPSPSRRREIRQGAGASLADMASLLGVSSTQVLKYEDGTCPRDPVVLARYVQLLDQLSREFGTTDSPRGITA